MNIDEALKLKSIAKSIDSEAVTHRNKFDVLLIQYLAAKYDVTPNGYCLKDGNFLQIFVGADNTECYLHRYGVAVSIVNHRGIIESKTFILRRDDINGF